MDNEQRRIAELLGSTNVDDYNLGKGLLKKFNYPLSVLEEMKKELGKGYFIKDGIIKTVNYKWRKPYDLV